MKRSIMLEKKGEGPQQSLNERIEIGIDEVGRGAVFGPVFSAAVVLSKKNCKVLYEKRVMVDTFCFFSKSDS